MVTSSARTIPPLENGDRLTRDEFERRYATMPDGVKAELIEGIVYMAAAAVRARHHGNPHALMVAWLGVYHAATPGTYIADNTTVRLDVDNEPQPDIVLCLDTAIGGQSRISEDDYIEGAPELVVEIAASSASYDLHAKLNMYRRNGVREYLVWQMYEDEFFWYRLEAGRYGAIAPNEQGLIESQVFPGLVLDVTALVARDLATVLAQLQRALGFGSHQDFVARLKRQSE
jgi:Uma2 family endonuclease